MNDSNIMSFIELEIERVNNECGYSHKHGSLKDFQDKQIELETLEKLYDKLNQEFFENVL